MTPKETTGTKATTTTKTTKTTSKAPKLLDRSKVQKSRPDFSDIAFTHTERSKGHTYFWDFDKDRNLIYANTGYEPKYL